MARSVTRAGLLGIAWLLTTSWVMGADTAADKLGARLAELDQLQGDFEQRQFDTEGRLLTASSGTFKLLRPGYFSWDIREPDSQLIIADPDYIWHHDRDLETVTRRPVASGSHASPLQVLGGDAEALRREFRVESVGANRFRLTPTADNPDFQWLIVQVAPRGIEAMEIRDRLDHRIEISLSALERDKSLTPADFSFSPPAGADLFYYDQ